MKTELFDYLDKRFGIPSSVFDGFEFYSSTRGRISLGPKKVISRPEPISIGVLAFRAGGALKPTTNLFLIFGKHATKNIINLDRANASAYAQGNDVRLLAEDLADCTEGYVIVSYAGIPMGCGHLRDGLVNNLVPKSKRMKLKYL
jgi:NOL1/NOP2/fmu family ribosome biogenesis protein